MNIKMRVFEVLEGDPRSGWKSSAFSLAIMALIFLNVVAVVLETVRDLEAAYSPVFAAFEIFSIIVFTAEYVLRLWVCTLHPRFADPFWGRIRFAMTPFALIDLLVIAPFYLPFFAAGDFRFLRAVRLYRILVLFKLSRYSHSLKLLGAVVNAKREELLIAVSVLAMLLVVSSSLVYYVENPAQPERFSSIPAAMWWSIATLTTVGYGDICPITPLGKFFGAIIAVFGIAMFALPAGIIAAGFTEEMGRHKAPSRVCPHCGKRLND